MKITNVFAGLSDPATLAKRAELTETASSTDAMKTAGGEPAQTALTAAALREILAKYDVTNISPNEFSRMLQDMADRGVISQKELQAMSAIRVDLDNAGLDPDDSLNLVEFYEQQIEQTRSFPENDPAAMAAQFEQTANLSNRLSWMQKFATMHSDPESLGLSAVA